MPRFNYESELELIDDYLKKTDSREIVVSVKFFDKFLERSHISDKIKWRQAGVVPYNGNMLKRGLK